MAAGETGQEQTISEFRLSAVQFIRLACSNDAGIFQVI
jgi:hypothetical protein